LIKAIFYDNLLVRNNKKNIGKGKKVEEKLKKWQIIYIDTTKYIVENMIEYKEVTKVWQEYKIQDERRRT